MTPLHVCLPTHDGRAEIPTIATILGALSPALGRPVTIHLGEAGNIPRARNAAQREAEASDPSDPLWCLWVDSDIRLTPDQAPALARYIERAEAEGVGFAVHYRQADGRSTFALTRGRRASVLEAAEVENLPDGQVIAMAGLGLAYLPMPRNYVWHADDMGEDYNMWMDTELPVRYAKGVEVRHHKQVFL